MNNSVYGSYRSRTFSDIFAPASGQESYDVFKDYYDNCGIPRMIREAQSGTKINSLQTLFYLLYANYGNSHIANSDESQFIYRLFSIIFMYGQAWEKRFDIQTEIKNFTEDDLLQGSKMIINHAYNNGSEPSVSELDAINEQNTQNSKRSKLDAYAYLWDMVKTDVTKEFLDKFKELFLVVVEPQLPLWYVTEEGEEEDD